MEKVGRTVPLYPMRVVQAATGLSARQVRYYERAGLVSPSRSSSGHRLYSWADIERLLEIKGLAERGVNIAGMRVALDLLERVGSVAQEGPPARRREVERGWAPVTGESPEHVPEGKKDLSSIYPVCNQPRLERVLLH